MSIPRNLSILADNVDPAMTGTVVGTTYTQTLTNKTLTSPVIDSAPTATVTGNAPLYYCRAWANIDGGAATPAVRSSGNVSSITDNGAGNYTMNFSNAMPDANYVVEVTGGTGSIKPTGAGQSTWGWSPYSFSTTSISASFWSYTGSSNTITNTDGVGTQACISIFR